MAKKTGTVKKRVVKVGTEGKVFVHSTFNNVIITIANADGQVISWSSAGKMGFRGSKKNTPYAAQTAATDCAKVAYDLGLRKVKVYVKGPGAGRESAIRTVHGAGIEVTEIVDVTAAQRLPSAQPPPRLISGPTPPERSVDGHTGGVSGSGVLLSGGFLPGYSPAAATGGLAAFPTLQAECRRHSKTEARPSLKQI